MTQPPVRDGVTGARVADELREAILTGVYPPGTRLRQEALADTVRSQPRPGTRSVAATGSRRPGDHRGQCRGLDRLA